MFCCNHCRCNMEDILLEMDRILRPEGAVIFRDKVDVLIKVRRIVGGMRWKAKMVDHEDGPLPSEKVLFTVKQYWVAGENNSTSSQWTSVFGLYIRGVIVSGRAQPFLVRSYRLLLHMGHLASSQPRNAVSAELFVYRIMLFHLR